MLAGHEIRTALEMAWHELENGNLLSAAEQSAFQVMVTGDKNLAYQQNLANRTIALIVLPTTDWKVLQFNAAPVVAAPDRATSGSFEQLDLTLPHK